MRRIVLYVLFISRYLADTSSTRDLWEGEGW